MNVERDDNDDEEEEEAMDGNVERTLSIHFEHGTGLNNLM